MYIKILSAQNLLPNIRAMNFAFGAMLSRIASGISQLYAIRIFLSNHSPDEYSTMIILLGLTPIFFLFEFGISQTLQNNFNQKKISADSMIKIMLLHYLIIIFIGLLISKSIFIPSFILHESLMNTTNIQIFTLGSLLLTVSSSNLILHKVLLLLRCGKLINVMVFITSVMQIIGLYVYNKIGASSPVISIFLFLFPSLLSSFFLLGWLTRKAFLKQTIDKRLISYDFYKTSRAFFLLNAMAASMMAIDYLILSLYGAANQIVSYHIVTRFFYLSYIVYISYLTFVAKKISKTNENDAVNKIRKTTAIIGVVCVCGVFIFLTILKESKAMYIISKGLDISYPLLISGLIYFLIRVFADIHIILAKNQSKKRLAFMVYLIQIFSAGILMYTLFPLFGEPSLFISLAIAYFLGVLFHRRQPKT